MKSKFLHMFVIIALVSIYDTALVIKYKGVIQDLELNPVGRSLMDYGGVWYFVATKLASTILVLLCLVLMRHFYKHTEKVMLAITCFQLGLLIFLECVHY